MTECEGPQKLYVDANVFITALDGPSSISAQLQDLFAVLLDRSGVAVTSELTLAEILPKATDWQKGYYLNLIIWNKIFDLRPVSREILIETADYRKTTGMPKLPDAIHVVTAIQSGCRIILSNDLRLRLPSGYTLIHLDPESVARLIQELS